MNISKLATTPIRLSYLGEGNIIIKFGLDDKGNKVFFSPSDAERKRSKLVYVDSNGNNMPNGAIKLSLASRTYQIPREEIELVKLLKNHPMCLDSKFKGGYALFKIVDELEDAKDALSKHNIEIIALQVFLNLQADKKKDLDDILYLLGYGNTIPLKELASKNPDKFLSYFEAPKDKPNSNGIKYSELKDNYRVEANLKRAINKGVVTSDDLGILYFKGKKLGINIPDAVVSLMSDNKENGKASTYPLILQDIKTV